MLRTFTTTESHEVVRTTLEIGETQVSLWRHGRRNARRLFVNLHQNERTSLEAGRLLLGERSFRLYHFETGGNRRIRFELHSTAFEFDPNRIFSRTGVECTLSRHNGAVPPAAVTALCRFAGAYTRALAIEQARAVVALHNTCDDYNVLAFLPGGNQAAVAAEVHIENPRHLHDFFYVSERAAFEALGARGSNVVLQAPPDRLDNDDGSLSIYCARRHVPYINVEAHPDDVEKQVTMLRELWEILDAIGR